MKVIAEKYFYSENRAFWDDRLKESREQFEWQSQILMELPEDTQRMMREALEERITQLLSELLPLPEKVCTVIDPLKYEKFRELVNESIDFAKDWGVNLQIFIENLTGCISFVGGELICYPEQMDMLARLNAVADEIHIAPSVDTGEGSPTDIDGGVRMECWFDFFRQVELE